MKKIYFGLVILAVAGMSAIVTFVATKDSGSNTAESNDYNLLSKRLFAENPNDIRINFSPLRKELKTYFSNNNVDGALYFEYLPTGTAIRVNDTVKFRGASLIKLPVAMELYKAHELGKLDIDAKVKLTKDQLNNGFGTLYQKGESYELTLRQAAQILLAESDNTALRVVLDATQGKLPADDLALGSLDVDFESTQDGVIFIGPRSYSSFFKCLYFACYNTKQNSQDILQALSKTDFNDRIVAGIDNPTNITIAHKIGVFNTQVQSDCGIIYQPNSPYLVCIMINGNNTTDTNQTFADLSKIIYKYIKLN